ncbi:MAG: 50S ribosomal protein L18 [Anaerolineales bacterium]
MGKRTRSDMRKRRHRRVRYKINGTAERPRLNVFRSINQIYAQLIDDSKGHTIVSASSLERELKADVSRVEHARLVGELLGKRANKSGVKQVVFDRGGYQYRGRVKALAEGARKAGLEF